LEDWAGSFARYPRIRDTLQTADGTAFDHLIATWLPLTYALNAVHRAMGKDDLLVSRGRSTPPAGTP
jgi:hypothetical protein